MKQGSTKRKDVGAPPGSLIHVGQKWSEEIKISVIDFNEHHFEERECASIEECYSYKSSETQSWINIDGLHDIEKIEQIGKHFGLHPLLLEDVLNTQQRPKVEDYEDYVFVSLKMLGINEKGTGFVSEQVSFVLGKNWVLSFQEQQGDVFDLLRGRLRENKGIIRTRKSDYLFYRFIDTIVDHYFLVVDFISDKILELEENTLKNPDNNHVKRIQHLKKQLVHLRKLVTPLRDALARIPRNENQLISPEIDPYFRDVYEHLVQVNEAIETQRDLLSSVMDLYLSGISNRMNQVMQVLTIISTIFIPLTFIAGIYGMNFTHMPELKTEYGYYVVWGIMIILAIIMILYFKRKRWL